jgi:predicted P-loop ATPase
MPEPATIQRLLPYALALAKRGWRVFPLHSIQPGSGGRCTCGSVDCAGGRGNPGKHPRTRHGLHDATTDADAITAWYRAQPDSNIGLVTGSGLAVIDVDPRHGGDASWLDLCVRHPHLETLTARTGGGGLHVFLETPAGVRIKSRTNMLPGVDVRGDGGYVVAAPSIHVSGRRYEWDDESTPIAACPPWMLELLTSARRQGPKPAAPPVRVPGGGYVAAAVRGELDRVAAAVEGSRNETLNRAAYSLGQLVGGGVLGEEEARTALERAGLSARLAEHEVKATTRSGIEAGKQEPRGVPERSGSASRPGEKQEVEDPPPEAGGSWRDRLTCDKSGRPDGSINNVAIILRNHPAWAGALAHDAFNHHDVWTRDPQWDSDEAPVEANHAFVDADEARLAMWLRRVEMINAQDRAIRSGIRVAADAVIVHPVLDYLKGLRWDGVCRMEAFASTYLGSDIADRHAVRGCYRWLLAACQRVIEPGVKVDSVLVLEGSQGIGKSNALRLLCGAPWFADDIGDPGKVDAAIALNGKWIIELGELRWKRSDEDTRKAFITRQVDHYRPPYGRRSIDVPRQGVFAGSTNAHDWQTDQTGARRYWAVRCGRIDREAIAADRDQIWAEAYLRATDGERHWLQGDEERDQREALEERRAADDWEGPIANYLDGQSGPVTVGQVLTSACGIEMAKFTQEISRRAATCMRRAGWEQRGKTGGRLARAKAWYRSCDRVEPG